MKSVVLIAAMCSIGGAALAGGPVETVIEAPVVATPAAAPTFDWNGFYAGLSFGNGSASDDGGLTDTGTDPRGFQIGYLRDLGRFVAGGELAYVQGGFDDFPLQSWDSTRLKLIGGYDAGRFLPYVFAGMSEFDVDDGSVKNNATIYGVGARYAVGAAGRIALGVEYLVESKDDFNGPAIDLDNNDLSLRLDYQF